MRVANYATMSALDASIDHNGDAIDAEFIMEMSAQCIMTGAATGAVKAQFSDDPIGLLPVDALGKPIPAHWNDLSGVTVTIGAAGAFAIPRFDVCYRWIRFVYTHNNGSAGTITVNVNSQGVQ